MKKLLFLLVISSTILFTNTNRASTIGISFIKADKCWKCNGSGSCSKCMGEGKLDCTRCNATGKEPDYIGGYPNPKKGEKCSDCSGNKTRKCGDCNGSGKCSPCKGTGKTR